MSLKNIWHILLILLVFKPLNVAAEENRTEVMVDFRVNVAHIDPNFSNNSRRIEQIIDYLNILKADSTRSISSVEFCGAASPEGPYSWNRYLAGARLASLEKLIRSKAANHKICALRGRRLAAILVTDRKEQPFGCDWMSGTKSAQACESVVTFRPMIIC